MLGERLARGEDVSAAVYGCGCGGKRGGKERGERFIRVFAPKRREEEDENKRKESLSSGLLARSSQVFFRSLSLSLFLSRNTPLFPPFPS